MLRRHDGTKKRWQMSLRFFLILVPCLGLLSAKFVSALLAKPEPLVRYEQIHVRFSDFAAREGAYQAICNRGTDVFLGRAPMAQYGEHIDWTPRSHISSENVRDAVFNLPEGQLSRVLEDEDGFYILRVLDRKEPKSSANG